MPGLTQKDLRVLNYYQQTENRELYFNYLAQLDGDDGYGDLALGVVRNDNNPGATANRYAKNYTFDQTGRILTSREWQQVGVDLIQEDYKVREGLVRNSRAEEALNLPVELVYGVHNIAFERNRMPSNAWTPAVLVNASFIKTGNYQEANKIWDTMLDNNWSGTERAFRNIGDQRKLSQYIEGGYFKNVSKAYLQAVDELDYKDPNYIGSKRNHYFRSDNGQWMHAGAQHSLKDGIPRYEKVTDPKEIQRLEDTYHLRMELQLKRNEFHPEDPNQYRQKPLVDTMHTIAQDDGHSSPASTPQPEALSAKSAMSEPPQSQPPKTASLLRAEHLYANAMDAVKTRYQEDKCSLEFGYKNVVMALTAVAHERGLERIDQVVFMPGAKPEQHRLIGVQGQDINNCAVVYALQAQKQPIESSVQQINQSIAREHARAMTQDGPEHKQPNVAQHQTEPSPESGARMMKM